LEAGRRCPKEDEISRISERTKSNESFGEADPPFLLCHRNDWIGGAWHRGGIPLGAARHQDLGNHEAVAIGTDDYVYGFYPLVTMDMTGRVKSRGERQWQPRPRTY
jgi:hypothetical protein